MKKTILFILSLVLVFPLVTYLGTNKVLAGIPLSGGYSRARYYAHGGRVDLTVQHLYLNTKNAIEYAKKSEMSTEEGIAWFGASFIPVVGPYIGIIGFFENHMRSTLVSDIRNLTDNNKCVCVMISKDKHFNYITAKEWDGFAESVKPDNTLNTDFRIEAYFTYQA